MSLKRRLKLRSAAWAESGQRCVYCGKAADKIRCGCEWNHETIEHIIPRSVGGPNESWNILAACAKCNFSRGVEYPISKRAHPSLRKIVLTKEARIFHWMPRLSPQIQEWLRLKYSQIPTK